MQCSLTGLNIADVVRLCIPQILIAKFCFKFRVSYLSETKGLNEVLISSYVYKAQNTTIVSLQHCPIFLCLYIFVS